MKFTKLIAIAAITSLAATANAADDAKARIADGAQAAQTKDNKDSNSKDINININTQAASPVAAQAQAQPTTVVEAAPVKESKADALRKARQDAEVQTEQKIVEKLEDSRLQEEKARADRLFGNKLEAAAPVAAVAAPAPAPTAPAPVVQESKPAQVTIEKVEIVQPAPALKAEPIAETKISAKAEEVAPAPQKFYVTGGLGNVSYSASNVHSNYALGVAIGTILDNRWGIELGYMYSNHNVDDIWGTYALYHHLDQNDISGAAKYYILSGKLKPYVGGSVTYINRRYTDRVAYGYGPYANSANIGPTLSTQAIDAGLLGGADFAITDSFMLGAGVDYNFNVMSMNTAYDNTNNYYSSGATPLEKISYWTLKLNAKFTF